MYVVNKLNEMFIFNHQARGNHVSLFSMAFRKPFLIILNGFKVFHSKSNQTFIRKKTSQAQCLAAYVCRVVGCLPA